MAQEIPLTISPADWSALFAELLAPCFTVAGALDAVARQVEEGRASLFAADAGGEVVGAFVLRVDGGEGVIAAAAGRLDGVDLVPALLPHIEARFVGCRAIRLHTPRPGLARLMAAQGYSGQEVVMRKELA